MLPTWKRDCTCGHSKNLDGKITLDYFGGSSAFLGVMNETNREAGGLVSVMQHEIGLTPLLIRKRKGGHPSKSVGGRKMKMTKTKPSLLSRSLQRGTRPCQHININAVKLILDF